MTESKVGISIKNIFCNEYGVRDWVIYTVLIIGVGGGIFFGEYYYSWLPEVNLVDHMNCTQLQDYNTHNANSGYYAKTQFVSRCSK